MAVHDSSEPAAIDLVSDATAQATAANAHRLSRLSNHNSPAEQHLQPPRTPQHRVPPRRTHSCVTSCLEVKSIQRRKPRTTGGFRRVNVERGRVARIPSTCNSRSRLWLSHAGAERYGHQMRSFRIYAALVGCLLHAHIALGDDATPTPTAAPVGPGVQVGTVAAARGEHVSIVATLRAGRLTVSGAQDDIGFDGVNFSIAALPNGNPDCVLNPTINAQTVRFTFRPPGAKRLHNQSGRAGIGRRGARLPRGVPGVHLYAGADNAPSSNTGCRQHDPLIACAIWK